MLKDSNSMQNTYHLSTNVETTLNELIKIFTKITDTKIDINYFPKGLERYIEILLITI